MESIRDVVVEAGLASQGEVDTLVAELGAFRRRPDSLERLPRIVQVWGHRRG